MVTAGAWWGSAIKATYQRFETVRRMYVAQTYEEPPHIIYSIEIVFYGSQNTYDCEILVSLKAM